MELSLLHFHIYHYTTIYDTPPPHPRGGVGPWPSRGGVAGLYHIWWKKSFIWKRKLYNDKNASLKKKFSCNYKHCYLLKQQFDCERKALLRKGSFMRKRKSDFCWWKERFTREKLFTVKTEFFEERRVQLWEKISIGRRKFYDANGVVLRKKNSIGTRKFAFEAFWSKNDQTHNSKRILIHLKENTKCFSNRSTSKGLVPFEVASRSLGLSGFAKMPAVSLGKFLVVLYVILELAGETCTPTFWNFT